MPSIPSSLARAQFTNDVVDVFRSTLPPSGFLRSFFPTVQAFTRYVSIEVKRNYENVAVDVLRGTEGNRNSFAKSTQKVIDPPYFREFFDLTELDLYDRLFGSTSIDAGVYSQMVSETAEKLMEIRAKIERAYEKMCAQVLELGTVTLVSQDSIDFGRKAGSLVANAGGNTWATGTVDPFATLAAGCQFVREYGKSSSDTFDAILGATALRDLYNNDIFKGRVTQALNNNIDSINVPRRNTVGGTFHGQLSCDVYKVNLWSDSEVYDVSGTPTRYINAKKVTIVPSNPHFKLAFAAVPRLIESEEAQSSSAIAGLKTGNVAAPYVVGEILDKRNIAHIIDVKSAGVPIPTAVDQIYTVQPVA
jgi:hypothetical protein